MHRRTITFSVFALLIALAMATLSVHPAWAQEPAEVEATGMVLSIDEAAHSFVLQTAEGNTTILVAEDFDFTTLAAGDLVEVKGTLNEDGSLTATSVQVEQPEVEPEEVEVTGTVLSIDEANYSFVIETAEGEAITVIVPEGFDFTTLAVGDQVEVKGTAGEDGTLTASEVKVEEPEDDEDETGPGDGYYCQNPEAQHPFGARLAERYEVDYTTLQAWFCDGFGWGQIMLALQTNQLTQDDPGALLEERRGGSGWGQIWQERHLVGKVDDADAPNDEDGNGRPDKPEQSNNGNGHGRPGDDEDLVETPEPDERGEHGRPDDNNGHGRPDKPENTRRPKP